MEREAQIKKISSAIKSIAKPWFEMGQIPSGITLKEVSRRSGVVNPLTLSKLITDQEVIVYRDGSSSFSLKTVIVDKEGNILRNPEQVKKSGREAAPYKKAVQMTAYRSRRPGGGPVVKRRVNEANLRNNLQKLGIERLGVQFEEFNQERIKQKMRQEKKAKLATRWSLRGENRKSEIPPKESQETGIVKRQFEILQQLGLWSNPDLFNKYSFRLSPDVLCLSPKQKQELEEICELMFAKNGFLDGASILFAKSADQRFLGSSVGGSIRRVLTSSVSKREIPFLDKVGRNLPFVCRLDLVMKRSPDSSEPTFQIVEIEGDKTHAFGYVSIADLFRETFLGREDTIGMVSALEECLKERQISPSSPLFLIVGKNESFYLRELSIFASLARKRGVNLITLPEDDVEISGADVEQKSSGLKTTTLVNIPSPSTSYGSASSTEKLQKLFQEGKLDVLIPPKRFLANKGLLGIVRNGEDDPELEKTLLDCFDPTILAKLRRFIPETIVITKRNKNLAAKILLSSRRKDFVIKEVMSSGMKGIALPSQAEKQEEFIKKALGIPNNFIIQKKVEQVVMRFKFVEPSNLSEVKDANMFMRVSLFATSNGIATVGVTARETPDVHGAKNSIQIPVIFE